jgi:hypothetical protein
MQVHIYLKGTDLVHLPASFGHRLLPILFAESGEMSDSNRHPHKGVLLVNLSGICFFTRRLGSSFHLKYFLSTYTISGIASTKQNRCQITTKKKTAWFTCEHWSEAISCVLEARRSLFHGAVDWSPIRMRGFARSFGSDGMVCLTDETTIAQLRYVCASYRYGVRPSERLIDLFRTADADPDNSMLFTADFPSAENLKSVILPIAQMGKLKRVHFLGFAPFSVCRLVHYLLKYSQTVRTIVFDSYSEMVPAQLRMRKIRLSPPDAVSFVFENCRLSDDCFSDLMQELCEYEWDYQRFTVRRTTMSPAKYASLFAGLKKGRPFRSLEVLELECFDGRKISQSVVAASVHEILMNCRFIQRFSLGRWSIPLHLDLQPFFMTPIMSQLMLQGLDMSKRFPTFEFPPLLTLLNFSGCCFSIPSLGTLFGNLSKTQHSLSLIMQDLVVPEVPRSAVFSVPTDFSRVQCLNELDWGGNLLDEGSIPQFVSFFFESNSIRFLSLDRIFRTATLPAFRLLAESLRPYALRGVSIGGGPSATFSGQFQEFLATLWLLETISILHLDDQEITDSDALLLLDFLAKHPSIRELSCDGTALSSPAAFVNFYRTLGTFGLGALGRPFRDVDRLFDTSEKLVNSSTSLFGFVDSIRKRYPSTTMAVRATYFSAKHPSDPFNIGQLHRLCGRFPACFSSFSRPDVLGISHCVESRPLDSICRLQIQTDHQTLHSLHCALLPEPHEAPAQGDVSGGGESLRRIHFTPSIVGFGPREISAVVPAEPLGDSPEYRRALSDLAREKDLAAVFLFVEGEIGSKAAEIVPAEWRGPPPVFVPEIDSSDDELFTEEHGSLARCQSIAFCSRVLSMAGFTVPAEPHFNLTESDDEPDEDSGEGEPSPFFVKETSQFSQRERRSFSDRTSGSSDSLLAHGGPPITLALERLPSALAVTPSPIAAPVAGPIAPPAVEAAKDFPPPRAHAMTTHRSKPQASSVPPARQVAGTGSVGAGVIAPPRPIGDGWGLSIVQPIFSARRPAGQTITRPFSTPVEIEIREPVRVVLIDHPRRTAGQFFRSAVPPPARRKALGAQSCGFVLEEEEAAVDEGRIEVPPKGLESELEEEASEAVNSL